MKYTIFLFLSFFVANSIMAQSDRNSIQRQMPFHTYSQALKLGDRALKRDSFKRALDLYFAAEAFDPTKTPEIKARINRVFIRINQLREIAVSARNLAEIEKNKADTARQEANASLMLAEKERQKADSLREIAEKERRTADSLRYLALLNELKELSRSMALKVLDLPPERGGQKAQLALNAFVIYDTLPISKESLYSDILQALRLSYRDLNASKGNEAIFVDLPKHSSDILATHSDSTFYTSGLNGLLKKWSLRLDHSLGLHKLQLNKEYSKYKSIHRALDLSPDGVTLAIGGLFPFIQFINMSNGSVYTVPFDKGSKLSGANHLVFHSDSLLFFSGSNNRIYQVSLDTKLVSEFSEGVKSRIKGLSRVGSYLIAGFENNHVQIWDLSKADDQMTVLEAQDINNPSVLETMTAHYNTEEQVLSIAVGFKSGDVKVFKRWGDDEFFDTLSFQNHLAGITCLAFGEGGTILGVGSHDRTVSIQFLQSEKQNYPIEIDGFESSLSSLAFLEDSKVLLAATKEGTLNYFFLSPEPYLRSMCDEFSKILDLSYEWAKKYGYDLELSTEDYEHICSSFDEEK